jgi:anti-sigma factor RsiW
MIINDTDLLAYVDGHLPEERRAEMAAAVARSAELSARVGVMRASALPYRAAFDRLPLPPVPSQLSSRVADLVSGDASRRQKWRRGARPRLAASFAAGALCCAVILKLLSGGTPVTSPAKPVSSWITAVADYQQLYSRETLANVAEDPGLSERVLSDLRVNDAMTIRVPDLRNTGLAFKRVQRLSFHEQPIVQMVYLPEHGEPVALCITPDTGPDEPPHTQQTGELSTVAWRRNHLGYLLLGRAPTQGLMDLGRRIARGDTPSLYGRTDNSGKAPDA